MTRSELLAREDIESDVDGYIDIPAELDMVFVDLLDRIHQYEHPNRTRSKFIVREAWIEHDEVAFSYSYQHCSQCDEELYTFRLPLVVFDAENLAEQLDIFFIELEGDRQAKKSLSEHFRDTEKERAEIRALRYLAQKYPQYLDLSVELPDLPPGEGDNYVEPDARVMLVRTINTL
jgi:hypothetical protein